jgi:hypothetical protein
VRFRLAGLRYDNSVASSETLDAQRWVSVQQAALGYTQTRLAQLKPGHVVQGTWWRLLDRRWRPLWQRLRHNCSMNQGAVEQ